MRSSTSAATSSGATSAASVSCTRAACRAPRSSAVRGSPSPPWRGRRRIAISGTTSEAGSNPAHACERPPSGANANPHSASSPVPSWPSVDVRSPPTAAAASLRQRSARPAKRSAPDSLSAIASPSAASATPPRLGCSSANHGSFARRDAHTTALGSMSPGSAKLAPTSVGSPLRLARSPASSSRACNARSCCSSSPKRPRGRATSDEPARATTTSRCVRVRSRSPRCASSRSGRTV